MGKKQITILFEVGESIYIIPLAIEGKVLSIWIGENGTQYQIRYFIDSEAKTVYFFPWEIEEYKESHNQKKIGISK
tara:strand:- start:5829 stop:6056 length:228 start_codon:yes stop_codon:yes gene_type:complete